MSGKGHGASVRTTSGAASLRTTDRAPSLSREKYLTR